MVAHHLFQRYEMILHEAVSGEIALPVVERSRALQIGEQQRQTAQFQFQIRSKFVQGERIAKRLVVEEVLSGEPRSELRRSLADNRHDLFEVHLQKPAPDPLIGLVLDGNDTVTRRH